MNYTIHYGNAKDLPALAKVHRAAFPGSLASAMGQRYVEKMLSWFLSSDKTFIYYAATGSGDVVGYCGGMIKDGTLTTGSASGMLQHSFNEAVKSMLLRPWLIFHKEMRSRYGFILTNLKKKITGKGSNVITQQQRTIDNSRPSTGLVGIGVKPEYFGKGVGYALLQEFERKTKELGITQMYLTVLADNEQAIKSYERSGWERARLSGKSLQMTKQI